MNPGLVNGYAIATYTGVHPQLHTFCTWYRHGTLVAIHTTNNPRENPANIMVKSSEYEMS